MTILATGTPWCIDTPAERTTARTVHRATCTGPSVGRVVPLNNMKDFDEEAIRALVDRKYSILRLCPNCLPGNIVWCDFGMVDSDGCVETDAGLGNPLVSLRPGMAITAQDLMGDYCPAVVESIDGDRFVLRLLLDRRQASE